MSGMTKLDSSHKQIRVDELVWKIYEKLDPKAKENKSGIKIQLQVTKPSLLEFPGNETLLYLALYNIVENAIKYSYGYPVEIILSENNNQLNIEVKDQEKEFLLKILLKLPIRFTGEKM